MSLVSVLIPAYNAASTIGETLASALAQSHRALEIIVVDDGSIDGTAEIVTAHATRDPRVTLLRQPNLGVAAARNAALAKAKGAYVAPLDADDLWHKDKIVRQLERLKEADRDVGLVYCWSVDIDAKSTVIDRRLDVDRFEGDVYAALVLANFIGNASVPLIRRSEIEGIGGWDPGLHRCNAQGCEDWQVYLRLAERTDYVLEPAFLVGYRQGAMAMSRNVASMRRSHRLVLEEARNRHPELPEKIFRWSQGAFDLYAFEILKEVASWRARMPHLVRGIVRDPNWLTRRSTRRKIRYALRQAFGTVAPSSQRPFPIGHPFSDLTPEIPYEVSEGATISMRRKLVRNLPIRRPAASHYQT